MKRKLGFLFVMIMLIVLIPGRAMAALPTRTYRVGFCVSDKYGYLDANNQYRGYYIALCDNLEKCSNFKIKMTPYTNVNELKAAVRQHQVDAAIGMHQNRWSEKEFIFSEEPVIEEPISIYTLADSDKYDDSSDATLDAMTIGYKLDSGYVDIFRDYCSEHGISPVLKEYSTDDFLGKALESGDIKGVLTGTAVPDGYKRIKSFEISPTYFMFDKSDTDFRDLIDATMLKLQVESPLTMSNIYDKYIDSGYTSISYFSKEEKEYLDKNPEITVALAKDAEPFVYEGKNGYAEGIIPDYYDVLGQKLGVKFRIILYKDTRTAISAVINEEADIAGHLYGDDVTVESYGLMVTEPYETMDCVMLRKNGRNNTVTSAGVTQRTGQIVKAQTGNELDLKEYKNSSDAYQDMMKGKIDGVISSMTAATWIINKNKASGVMLTVLPDARLNIVGCVTDDNYMLLSILNKAIRVSRPDMIKISTEYTSIKEVKLGEYINSLPTFNFLVSTIVLALTTLILLIILIRILVLKRIALKKARQEAGKIKLRETVFYINDIINDGMISLNAMTEKKKQNLKIDVPEKEYVVMGDKRKLERILLKLAGNAIYYTDEGGQIGITINCEENQENIIANLVVRDNGKGMEADVMDHLFDETDYSSDEPDVEFKANGLFMVKKVAELMGGTVNIASEDGQGTVVTVSIPLAGGIVDNVSEAWKKEADKSRYQVLTYDV